MMQLRTVQPKYMLIVVLGALFFTPLFFDAPVPILIEQTSLKDITLISNPSHAQMFHGELKNFPHTYEIRATEPFTLFTQIFLPDIETSKNNISGIIIKEQRRGSRAEEVVRLPAKDASWNAGYSLFVGDFYREGGSFERELGAGVYRIEVGTPDNLDKYVLMVGTDERMTLGYFERLKRVAEVREFFGKTRFSSIESLIVLMPLLGFAFFIGYFMYRRARPR